MSHLITALQQKSSDKSIIDIMDNENEDVDVQDVKGKTALMFALEMDYSNVILNKIIDKSINLDLQNQEYGDTALMLALYKTDTSTLYIVI